MRSRHLFRVTLCTSLIVLLIACSKREQAAEASMDSAASAPAAAPAMVTEAAVGAAAPAPAERRLREDASADAPSTAPPTQAQLSSSAATYTDAQRKFIRTAQASFRVKDVYQSALAIEDAVAAQGGFVVRNEIAADVQEVQRRPKGDGKLIELAEYTVRGNLSVRVPSDKAQAFLRSIVNQMEFLDRRNFDAADAQFAMLRQQLAYQRSQETQQELGQATQQGGKLGQKVESIAARSDAKSSRDEALVAQKEFEDRVAFASIDLSLYQLSKIRQTELTDVEAVFEANGPGFFTRLGSSLRIGWYGVLEAFIQTIKLWPLWLLLLFGYAGYRRFRKKQA
ncbi:DUF4349 domain-containing protein [Pseudoxanthomonas sacheonensis]|uniref:DUF4349 domain-containing protein n=1 Tax=Pseudoxanthomonas sacheonensis TaxID=443615 RepID=UPI0013D07D72|nr:DUF4349 domain-containing protein [Pseudoxanthomonas sacheonensis]KAF1709078.1 hypothetical protein CSC73_07485 [Pseudoxanthomonas sacheonensis]